MLSVKSINVFLSYGTDWEDFALGFRSSYVGGKDQFIKFFDWQGVDAVPAGEDLAESLRNQIATTDVFVAFVDEQYNSEERKTRLELQHALSILERRGGHLRILLFFLSPESKNVISDLPYAGAGSLRSMAWEECYDQKGVVVPPKDNPALHQRIVKLREKHLTELRDATSPTVSTASDLSAVVLLDRAIIPDDCEEVRETVEGAAAKAAASLLQEAGAKVFRVQPGWHSRLKLELNFDDGDLRKPAFVQILSAGTFARSIEDPGILGRRLGPLASPGIIRHSRLALWLPEGEQRPADFEARLRTNSEADPAIRGDNPKELAEWLKPKLGLGLSAPVAAYQDVDNMVQHRDTLRREVAAVVESALPGSPDDQELHAFDAAMLRPIVSALAKRRPIIVAHNLRLNQTSDPQTLRRDTIKYFRNLASDADEVLQEKDVRPEEVFWLAIVQDGNPIVTTASLSIPLNDFKLSRWFVLGLTQSENGSLRFEQGQRRAAVVQRLLAWAREAGRGEAHA